MAASMKALPHARRRTQRLRVAALLALVALMLAAALAPLPVQAQLTQGGLVLTSVRGLDFGRFAAGQGSSGSVTVAASGMRSATGGVILLASNGGAAARFHLDRAGGSVIAPPLAVSLSLPSGRSAMLSNGTQGMTAGAFQAWPASVPGVPDGGIDIAIGATLEVAAGQAPGAYSGAFSVTVNYE